MRSKGHKAITVAERAHLARVKALACGVCGAAGPSDAHHIEQERHFLAIPLCPDCHTGGFNGLHGQRRAWLVRKLDELAVLNDTIRRLNA